MSKQDEYFNFMVKLGIDRDRFATENADSLETINKLARPESRRFREYLSKSYLPSPAGFNVDRNRVGIVLRRIVRGLFYYHTEECLPDSVPFNFVSIENQPRLAVALSEEIDILTKRMKTIGGGVFRYAFMQDFPSDAFETAWLVSFYDQHKFLCITVP